MNLLESVRTALRSIASNKMRSFLTMLGMIIGVAAVIALMAAGAGTQAQVASQFESLGSNLLVISSRQFRFRGVSMGQQSSSGGLTEKDVESIEALSAYVATVAPEYSTSGQIVYGSNNTQASVVGVTPAYAIVRDWGTERGRFISALDESTHAKVVVLGADVADELFGDSLANPIGKTVKINRQNYEVVGILEAKGTSSSSSLDGNAYIPLSTAQARFGGAGTTSVTSINVQATSANAMDAADAELTAILRASHGLSSNQSDDFTVQNQTQIVEMVSEMSSTFSTLLSSIASISLIVGGIGIMNIMLVSVTERTREIGIRKSTGARRRDILTQFLVEAIVLSLAGGVVGVLVGFVGAGAVTSLLGGSSAVVTPQSVALALGVSVGVGLFFGIYPANRAAGLSPIEALRYE
ncbi:MAG: FtsX-like permease family protein [Chloroflexi bacterium]|nr:FtsX-like permease family protein [Chloroflexota bacterium]